MKNIYLREIQNYFNTPIGYVFAVTALFFNLLFFFTGFFHIPAFWEAKVASIRSYMDLLPLTFILMVPAVSMRIWAEEYKTGTIELLATLPISTESVVIGKFLAAWTFVVGLILASLPLTFGIWWIGHLDWGSTVALYLGAILMAGAYVGLGMLISAFTREQIVAFILIFFVSLIIYLSNFYVVSRHLPPVLSNVVSFFTLSSHLNSFARGVIDLGDTVYFVSFTVLMLAANVGVLRSRT
ncbi:MAG: ABC transporter permease subunit [Leptospiraceae bacterium]